MTYRPQQSMIDLEERIQSKIMPVGTGCWLWTGGLQRGYGRFSFDGRCQRAHRVIYELLVGSISEDLEIDHLCRVKSCVNPAHLEAVTHQENIRRGMTGKVNHWNSRKTHCKRGHPLSGYNLYQRPTGQRVCRECQRVSLRKRRAKNRIEVLEAG